MAPAPEVQHWHSSPAGRAELLRTGQARVHSRLRSPAGRGAQALSGLPPSTRRARARSWWKEGAGQSRRAETPPTPGSGGQRSAARNGCRYPSVSKASVKKDVVKVENLSSNLRQGSPSNEGSFRPGGAQCWDPAHPGSWESPPAIRGWERGPIGQGLPDARPGLPT